MSPLSWQTALEQLSAPVLRLRRRSRLSMAALSAAIAGWILVALLRNNENWAISHVVIWSLVSLCAMIAALLSVRRPAQSGQWKKLIQSATGTDEQLRTVLMTAIELQPDADGHYRYLQQRVLEDAAARAQREDWTHRVGKGRLAFAGLAEALSLLLLVSALGFLLKPLAAAKSSVTDSGLIWVIQPGDADVIRGQPVVVTARFPRRVPDRLTLWAGPAPDALEPLDMRRHLEDPVYGLTLPSIQQDLFYQLRSGKEASRLYKLSQYDLAALSQAEAHIVYPAETGLKEEKREDVRRLSVVAGSQINWTFKFNQPLGEVRLVPDESDGLALSLDAAGTAARWTLQAEKPVKFKLEMLDPKGHAAPMTPRFEMEVHANHAPRLRPVFPGRDREVSALEELQVEAEAIDDFGLLATGVTYALGSGAQQELRFPAPEQGSTRLKIDHTLALEALGAKVGDMLVYHFWAEDRGPGGTVRRSSSDLYFSEVRPFEMRYREAAGSGPPGSSEEEARLAQMQKELLIGTWKVRRRLESAGATQKIRGEMDELAALQKQIVEAAELALQQSMSQVPPEKIRASLAFMQEALKHLQELRKLEPGASDIDPAIVAEKRAYEKLLGDKPTDKQVARGKSSGAGKKSRTDQELENLELQQEDRRYETEQQAQNQQARAQQQEMSELLRRLRSLAKRQEALNDQARQEATKKQEPQESELALQRLKQQQEEIQRELESLQQILDRPQNRGASSELRNTLERSRQQAQSASQQLNSGKPQEAAAAGSAAQREMEQAQQQLRSGGASALAEELAELKKQARDLEESHRETLRQIEDQTQQSSLRKPDTDAGEPVGERIAQQQKQLENLFQNLQQATESAEEAEPLVADKLYDALRRTRLSGLEQQLEQARQWADAQFLPEARQVFEPAGGEIKNLRQSIDRAAESIAGNSEQALRQAQQQVQELLKTLEQAAAGQQQASNSPSGSPSPGSSPGSTPSQAQGSAPGSGKGSTPGQSPESQGSGPGSNPGSSTGSASASPGGAGSGPGHEAGAQRLIELTPDKLADVEKLLEEPQLREQAAAARQAARSLRAEMQRHGETPKWDVLRQRLHPPLTELRDAIAWKLAQGQPESMAPLDRDPVPPPYSELVKQYYRRLGGGK